MGWMLLPMASHAASASGPVRVRQMDGGSVSQNEPFVTRVCFGMLKRSNTGAIFLGFKISKRSIGVWRERIYSMQMLPSSDLGRKIVLSSWMIIVSLLRSGIEQYLAP